MPELQDIALLLNQQVEAFNHRGFIPDDPVQIPHRFTRKEDIEIAGFLAATIAWGQRVTILNNASKILECMDNSPYTFLLHHQESDLKPLQKVVHRTFNGDDALFFVTRLSELYRSGMGLEGIFQKGFDHDGTVRQAIHRARREFFLRPHLSRSEKHFSDPLKGSAAKRLNMFLRWMVRKDEGGVDFGIWQGIPSSALKIPLDIHTGNVARKLGILRRKQNDWKAVEELTDYLLKLDPADPVKYDFALFGMGTTGRIPA